ncbi:MULTISPECIES: 16S rRNA (guanine(527)-N(7))-methyltransferase RsmG [Prochlorococcus]|uniref:16S rRNA (guanine(527)-N(7))-methyltransferase RsmG n=1 Tax=Prochlorococcus TaxID=1218 RepID=UPI000533BC2F|nr:MULTISPECIES: 16S rRNA (guanine(527)-N(7))-methyltransferase RsmG [Prochlorococcus]KGG13503.1 rRNA small subunit 7-methylguanosine (m7G) methyltransferase GidB [Prochlorococcus sp. MIT 0601]
MPIKDNYSNKACFIWDTINWVPSSKQFQQFLQLQSHLQEWNNSINLTRLLYGSDYWVSQVIDSLWPIKNELQTTSSKKIVDIGTGCGFPGLAIAIALPYADLTLVDSTSRKTKVLQSIVDSLGLRERVRIRTERAEITGQNACCREFYDIAVARAVSSAPIVAEYLVPLLTSTGEAILYKGQWSQSDHNDLNSALKHLKAKITNIESIYLPEEKGVRHAITLMSVEKCPLNYPRSIGIPAKRPLGT